MVMCERPQVDRNTESLSTDSGRDRLPSLSSSPSTIITEQSPSSTMNRRPSKPLPPPISISLAQKIGTPAILIDRFSPSNSLFPPTTPLDLTLQEPVTPSNPPLVISPGPQIPSDLLPPLSSLKLDEPAGVISPSNCLQQTETSAKSSSPTQRALTEKLDKVVMAKGMLEPIQMGGGITSGVNQAKTHSVNAAQMISSCESEQKTRGRKIRKRTRAEGTTKGECSDEPHHRFLSLKFWGLKKRKDQNFSLGLLFSKPNKVNTTQTPQLPMRTDRNSSSSTLECPIENLEVEAQPHHQSRRSKTLSMFTTHSIRQPSRPDKVLNRLSSYFSYTTPTQSNSTPVVDTTT